MPGSYLVLLCCIWNQSESIPLSRVYSVCFVWRVLPIPKAPPYTTHYCSPSYCLNSIFSILIVLCIILLTLYSVISVPQMIGTYRYVIHLVYLVPSCCVSLLCLIFLWAQRHDNDSIMKIYMKWSFFVCFFDCNRLLSRSPIEPFGWGLSFLCTVSPCWFFFLKNYELVHSYVWVVEIIQSVDSSLCT